MRRTGKALLLFALLADAGQVRPAAAAVLPGMTDMLERISVNGLIALAAGAVVALGLLMIGLARRGRGRPVAAQPNAGAAARAQHGKQAGAGGVSDSIPTRPVAAPSPSPSPNPKEGHAEPEGGVVGWFEIVGEDIRLAVARGVVGVGRHEENDIRLQDRTVHRHHAVLHSAPENGLVITDLSGAEGNGVLVNDEPVSQAVLESGDVVVLGAVRLRFHMASNEAET